MAWLYRPGITTFSEMTDLAKPFREMLDKHAFISDFGTPVTQCSEDGAIKFAFRLPDGLFVESVLIPEEDRNTLCISSQVGCAMACSFCQTGTMGLTRNLTAAEIVNQVCGVRDYLLGQPDDRRAGPGSVTNI
ncbi:MAG: 23S rRNA (adenine(2503)-C(2))-methyltransferase RlmN, partial [Desulfofustis sp.]|nr:23S rRNA (adenine(2503)-C(2))-methyltransferase RlmN [Desulfofustis sp.]